MHNLNKWAGECLRKKPLPESIATAIIKEAKKDDVVLYKYFCLHCNRYHLTRDKEHEGVINDG